MLVPAALAAAELDHVAPSVTSSRRWWRGYDVIARLSKALGPSKLYDHGFHPSALTGTIGAAVCAGRVLGLDDEEMHAAIALAASQCSGLLTYYGDPFHRQKSFQTGMAARNGVTAARFAKAGYCATPDVLAGRRSVLEVFGREHADPRAADRHDRARDHVDHVEAARLLRADALGSRCAVGCARRESH